MRIARALLPLVGVLISIVAALVVTSVATPSSASAATYADAGPMRVSAVEPSFDASVLYWTNLVRKQHGLRPLKAGPCVDRFAETWTANMAARDVFRHQRLRPILRRCHRHRAAENIAYATGSLSAQQVVQMWMRSPGHRHNILTRRYKALGVSAWRSADTGRVYVTQDFAG